MSRQFNRIFCIGRNYVKHIEELNNERPKNPVVFMKPVSSIVPSNSQIIFPEHGKDMHHEAELVLLIGKNGKAKTQNEAMEFVESYTIGLDLTLRDVQQQMKEKGLPWEKAKAFDDSAPLGELKPYEQGIDLNNYHFTLKVNGEIRQTGDTNLMIFPIETIIVELSKIWTLQPGDLIYTGTPEGVGPLVTGDEIELNGDDLGPFFWSVKE